MKLTNKFIKIPLISLFTVLFITGITYFIITTFSFSFDSDLVSTARAEITGEPDEINNAVSAIYSKTDIIDTEIGSNSESKQVQRIYFAKNDDTINTIKDIVAQNPNLVLTIADTTPGFKTDFSDELISLLAVVLIFLFIINFTLFRKVMDYQYIFLYTLLNIFTVLISVCILLAGFSLMGKYGWHISNFSLNSFVAYVFSVGAMLSVVSLSFRKDLGDVEFISSVGTHFNSFVSSSLRAYIVIILILIISLAPFIYFYYYKIEALTILVMGILVSFTLSFAYPPILKWYDQVRAAKTKFNKKKR